MQEQNQDPNKDKQGAQRDQGGAPGPGAKGSQINLDPTMSPETSASEDTPVEQGDEASYETGHPERTNDVNNRDE